MQPTLPEVSSLAILKMVAASYSKTSLTNYQSTQHHIPEDCNPEGQHLFTIHKLSLLGPNVWQGLIVVHNSQ
jgi:hypothetical protein